jgi:hypothetical protein
MSYVIYNNKRVSFGNKYVAGVAPEPIPGQIYFNKTASADEVIFDSLPDVTGSKTVKMGFYVQDSSSSLDVAFANGTTQDYLRLTFGEGEYGPTFMVEVRQSPSIVRRVYDISDLYGEIVNLEVVKGTASISSVTFNGNTLTDLMGYLAFGPTAFKRIRGSKFSSIFNLEIVGAHKWIGYPYGNTDAAWVDTIGSNDGIISGTPSTINLF